MITRAQLLSILILTICFNNFGVYKIIILSEGQRDTWIGVLASALPALLLAGMLAGIYNRISTVNLYDWLKQRAGSAITSMLIAVLSVILLVHLLISMIDLTHWLNVWYLPNTPNYIIVVLISSTVLLGSLLGLRTLAIATGILLPLNAIVFFVLLFGVFKFLHLSELLPILENGWLPAGGAAKSTLVGLLDWLLLIVLIPFADHKINIKTLYVLLLLHILMITFQVVTVMSAFGSKFVLLLRTPVFELWRIAEFGAHFTHIDSLSIFYFFSASLIRQSLLLIAIGSLLPRKTIKPSAGFLLAIWVGITCIGFLSVNDLSFVRLTTRWHDLVVGVGLGGALFLFYLISLRRMKVNSGVR